MQEGVNMEDFFEINHNPMKLSEIKDYRVVEKEMIMRPVFKESVTLFGVKYRFEAMEPYAVIIDEKGNEASMKSFKPMERIDYIVKDAMRPVNAVIDTIGDKLNIKTLKYKEYTCRLFSGRIAKMYLADVPVRLMTRDGRAIDIYKDTPEHQELGQNTSSAVQLVPALQITFKTKRDDMLFFGVGVQPIDVSGTYESLKNALTAYQASLPKEDKKKSLADRAKGFFNKQKGTMSDLETIFDVSKQLITKNEDATSSESFSKLLSSKSNGNKRQK